MRVKLGRSHKLIPAKVDLLGIRYALQLQFLKMASLKEKLLTYHSSSIYPCLSTPHDTRYRSISISCCT